MSKWISVDDKLPDVGDSVLSVGSSPKEEGVFLSPVVCSIQKDGRFMIGYSFEGSRKIGFFVETFPTHWMPLPEPPKD